jgi:hypothetical protein
LVNAPLARRPIPPVMANVRRRNEAVAIDKVREWLNKSRFQLEMAAAASFRSVGFDVPQSFAYADPQSDKGRGEELGSGRIGVREELGSDPN